MNHFDGVAMWVVYGRHTHLRLKRQSALYMHLHPGSALTLQEGYGSQTVTKTSVIT